jgi:hypothetical protein
MSWNKFIKWLDSRATQEPAVVYQEPTLLQRGKWVMAGGAVGIVSDTSNAGVLAVDHTDAAGLTTHTKHYPAGQVTIARLADIPGPRRPISGDAAAKLGYF